MIKGQTTTKADNKTEISFSDKVLFSQSLDKLWFDEFNSYLYLASKIDFTVQMIDSCGVWE